MKSEILTCIRQLAEAADGQPPTIRQVEEATGIGESGWRGIYWANWGDAVIEAGLTPNPLGRERRIDDDVLLEHLAKACRAHGRIPTVAQLRIMRRSDPDFPYVKTFERRLGGFSAIGGHIASWVAGRSDYQDVAALLGTDADAPVASSTAYGSVYLLKSGTFYKIGRSDELERRVKEIRVALPEAVVLVHAISTDDPPGCEFSKIMRFIRDNATNWSPASIDAAGRRATPACPS